MFYVSVMVPLIGSLGYRIVDFTTKDEQDVTREELIQRCDSGETIIGVSKVNEQYVIASKGKAGQITLEDFAILTDRKYLLDEFDCNENQTNPDKISYATHKKVAWKCEKGHKYLANVSSRTGSKSGCPYCSGNKVLKGYNDFETWCKENNRQDLLDEWNYELNEVEPNNISYGSKQKINWICTKGHLYKIVLKNRSTQNMGCPYCSHRKLLENETDLQTWCIRNDRSDLLDEWDYEKNKLKPNEVFPNYNKKVYWICREKRHSYASSPNKRVSSNGGCPYCHAQTSFPEQAILYYIKQLNCKVESRFKYQNKYEVDIFLADYNVGVEYDGVVWHLSDRNVQIDENKNKVLCEAGIHLMRLREEGCPKIERYGSEEIIVRDLDTAIKELFSLLSSKYGISIDVCVNTKRDRQKILAEYRSSKEERSIKFTHPQVATEWCREKNGDLRPEMFTSGSHEKVWWLCRYCGHEWKSAISDRCCRLMGCPICRKEKNNLSIKHLMSDDFPEIISFWANENPSMYEIPSGTAKELKINCPICKFEEKVKYLKERIKRQNGLTCKKCGYHVEVQKWNKEREEFLEEQKRGRDLYESFKEFLKSQGK